MSWSSFTINRQAILDSLIAQRGTGYTHDPASKVGVELDAYAAALAAAWDQNRRLALQWDPTRCTDFLARWERVYGLRPLPRTSDPRRRTALAAKWRLEGESPTATALYDLLHATVPDLSPVIVNTPSWLATTHVQLGASVPGGVFVPAEPAGSTTPWSSSVAHLTIKLTKPIWMDDATFFALAGTLDNIVDPFLPSTSTWNWLTGAGFVLDENNLDVSGLGWTMDITIGASVTGRLLATSKSLRRPGSYADYWLFEVEAGPDVTVTIDLTSTDFDTYLVLRSGTSPDGTIIAYDDDGGPGANSQIVMSPLPPGWYVIEATSFSAATLGDYTLAISSS